MQNDNIYASIDEIEEQKAFKKRREPTCAKS